VTDSGSGRTPSDARLAKLREIVEKSPHDARARYFLANELFRAGEFGAAAEAYAEYLRLEPGDEGVGHKNHGLALERTGRTAEAAESYRRGIAAANVHGHDGLAGELRFLLEALED
jgi:Flp pilus assembly protein TadD